MDYNRIMACHNYISHDLNFSGNNEIILYLEYDETIGQIRVEPVHIGRHYYTWNMISYLEYDETIS